MMVECKRGEMNLKNEFKIFRNRSGRQRHLHLASLKNHASESSRIRSNSCRIWYIQNTIWHELLLLWLLPDHEMLDDFPEIAFDREHRPQAAMERHQHLGRFTREIHRAHGYPEEVLDAFET